MSYMRHDAVVITTWDKTVVEKIEAYRDGAGGITQALLHGPFEGIVNYQATFVWIPDGSKEGWGDSDRADDARNAFIDFLEQNNFYTDAVILNFGGDDPQKLSVEQLHYLEKV